MTNKMLALDRTTMMKPISKHERWVAWEAVRRARAVLGEGWAHVSDEIRWGLVCADLLSVVARCNAMDDGNATDREKADVADYALALWRAAHDIRENGWRRL